MALFEVFIPGREAGTPNVTLTIDATNWIGALRSGLKSIGEGQEAIANVMCDIKEDNSIHVTDVATRRVFRLREVHKKSDTGPRPISMEGDSIDESDTQKMERPPEMTVSQPKTLVEFPAPRFSPPPAAAAVAAAAAPIGPADHSVPWTKMPGPDAGKIPDAKSLVSPAASSSSAVPPKSTLEKLAPQPVTTPDMRVGPAATVAAIAPVAAAKPTTSTTPLRSVSPPTPRGVPAPAPKRPSGQFQNAPDVKTREVSTANPQTDPKIGRGPAKVDVQEAIAAVFDATQDLYMETSLSAQHVADKLLDIALAHIPAEAGTFYLADVNGHALTFAAVRGPKADALKRSGMTVKVGQGIIGFCAQEGVCLVVADIQKDPRFLASIAKSINYQPKDTLCASAEKDGRLWGALQLINCSGSEGFDASHMEVLRFIGLTAAAMLERAAERD